MAVVTGIEYKFLVLQRFTIKVGEACGNEEMVKPQSVGILRAPHNSEAPNGFVPAYS
jgi:hypothetical protein